jgi:hypothetical protein
LFNFHFHFEFLFLFKKNKYVLSHFFKLISIRISYKKEMPKSTNQEPVDLGTMKITIVTIAIISIVSLFFSILALSRESDKEYNRNIANQGWETTLNNNIPNTEDPVRTNNMLPHYRSFNDLPLVIINDTETYGNINNIEEDNMKQFIDTSDPQKITIFKSGLYLLGYDVLWLGASNDVGSVRETFLHRSGRNIIGHSLDYTFKVQSIRQQYTTVRHLNNEDFIKISFKQDSKTNITLFEYNVWLILLHASY